jgi:pimeloyl-ACP methyl ester carboxylesterase
MTVRSSNGTPVKERLVTLGPNRLFGIATTGEGDPKGPTVLFLNSGSDPHTGPNRMWVELGRSWASLGFPCIRFDLSGLGDSPVRTGQIPYVVRAPEAFDDMVDVVGAVVDRPPDSGVVPVVFAGLCSGAYQALESAIDLHPLSVLSVNPLLRFQPSETGPLDPRRKLCKPAGSLRTAYRTLPSWKILRLARKAYVAVARLRPGQRSALSWLSETSARGTDILCICGELEAAAFFESEPPRDDHRLTQERLQIDLIEGLDHGLMLEDHRAAVVDRLTQHMATFRVGEDHPQEPTSPPGPLPPARLHT